MSYRTTDAGAAAGWMAMGIMAIATGLIVYILRRTYNRLTAEVESRR